MLFLTILGEAVFASPKNRYDDILVEIKEECVAE